MTLRGPFGPALLDQALHLLDVPVWLGLALEASGGHVADLAVDGALGPAAVVLAEDPGDVGGGGGVAAVGDGIVVEVERGAWGVWRRGWGRGRRESTCC